MISLDNFNNDQFINDTCSLRLSKYRNLVQCGVILNWQSKWPDWNQMPVWPTNSKIPQPGGPMVICLNLYRIDFDYNSISLKYQAQNEA